MRLRRASLLMTVIAFARSERGRQMIDQARQKYDTPANRTRVRTALHGMATCRPRSTGCCRSEPRARTSASET
jgi:hypothetical protein